MAASRGQVERILKQLLGILSHCEEMAQAHIEVGERWRHTGLRGIFQGDTDFERVRSEIIDGSEDFLQAVVELRKLTPHPNLIRSQAVLKTILQECHHCVSENSAREQRGQDFRCQMLAILNYGDQGEPGFELDDEAQIIEVQ